MYFLHLLTTVLYIDVFRVQGKERDNSSPLIGTNTVKQSQISILDNITTYNWMNFDAWQCNLPADFPASTWIRASYYSRESCYERILVLSQSSFASTEQKAESWIYRLESNSWEIIRNRNQEIPPKVRVGSIFVTVCRTKVLYFTPQSATMPSVWMFDGDTDTWSRKSLIGDTYPKLTDSESAMFFALLDRSSNSSSPCECRYAVIGISTVERFWTLRCDDTMQKYVWKRKEAGNSTFKAHSLTKEDIYPRKVIDSTGVAVITEGLVLVMAENGLWRYSLASNQWYQLDRPFPAIKEYQTIAAFYAPSCKMYILCLVERVMAYSLEGSSWRSFNLHDSIPKYIPDYHYVAMTTDNYRLLLYGGGLSDCKQMLSERPLVFTMCENFRFWGWEEIMTPTLSPSTLGTLVESVDCVEDVLFVLVHAETRQLWLLNLNAMTWTFLTDLFKGLPDPYDLGSVAQSDSIQHAVFYGTVYLMFFARASSNMWIVGYNTKNYSWHYHDDIVDIFEVEGSIARTDSCISAVNSSTVVLYGGKTPEVTKFRYLQDLWLVTLPSPEVTDLEWRKVEPVSDQSVNSTIPFPRTLYQCVVVENTLVVLGGIENRSLAWVGEGIVEVMSCYRDVWHFSLLRNTWTHSFIDDSNDRSMCIVSAVSVGEQVVVTFRSTQDIDASKHRRYQLWFYFVQTNTWTFHSEMISSDQFRTFLWRGRLFFFQQDLEGLSYKDLFCPPGFSSRDISKEVCDLCSEGSYAEGLGEKICTPCPSGLTTKSKGSTASRNCSYCKEDYCRYGDCTVVLLGNGETHPRCQCRLGFSGVNCRNPRDILIAAAVSVSTVLAVCGVVVLVRAWKNKRLRERSLIHHVEELTNVWQINENEIAQLEVIGAGGYGDVFKVRYRDMFAAMKILRQPADDSFLWEFEREIKFMQTVRHPNIVLFLGAGRTAEGSPFIISEFVSRGSLRDLLDDQTQDISHALTVKFALDVARGMNFLHSLSPPRVHRDLKSDNLLISETNIVKITDFGLGKQVSMSLSSLQQPRRRRRIWGHHSDSETVPISLPLLQTRGRDSPHALGAARWRAPELLKSMSSRHYTKAADVYR